MKKTLKSIFVFSILTLFFWNCKEEKVISETEFEQNVFYEVFPAILDSIYYEKRLAPPPPPPPEFFQKEEYKNDIDKGIQDYKQTDKYKNDIKKWERKKDFLERDNALIYLVISDSIGGFEKYKIDLNRLKSNNEKIKFKYRSEFPNGREFWRTEYDFFIAASIHFGGIIFDKTKNTGVLNGGYTMGILNGSGFRIFIKKNDSGKWIIDKIEGTWIS
ncbi:hypothetical protein [Olleya sp. R77988]|uniref:hypothetical protein n=1 Tax=Olleya sp. R77988 TaxID=3093875 RepID=UPI0037C807E2